ncbi:hypothetical protein [Geobacter sp. AOG2]|uniref:hypothetical protein n=1 Tax=Geobacter sp. AOG2 TaxID=1566347 RepID=UPI001CC5E419|nr:hypothetical protein [Geobacter sp. AOG2]GFE60480.1 hypothetical protein AOG2_10680 [Geobacter sp. AOG2]
MKTLLALSLVLTLAICNNVVAADSIGIGIRDGIAHGHYDTNSFEVFGDLYLNPIISVGASAGYVMPNKNHINSIQRDKSVPITALFKAHLPIPFIRPYAGLGEAVEFHGHNSATYTPVVMGGADIPLGLFFLNAEYRRHVNDRMDFFSIGAGVKF